MGLTDACQINLGHLNMSHSESVRNCRIPQIDFKNCNNPALAHVRLLGLRPLSCVPVL